MRRAGDIFGSSELGGGSRESKASVRWLNGSGGRGDEMDEKDNQSGHLFIITKPRIAWGCATN